jgi:hypothetical protein
MHKTYTLRIDRERLFENYRRSQCGVAALRNSPPMCTSQFSNRFVIAAAPHSGLIETSAFNVWTQVLLLYRRACTYEVRTKFRWIGPKQRFDLDSSPRDGGWKAHRQRGNYLAWFDSRDTVAEPIHRSKPEAGIPTPAASCLPSTAWRKRA